MAVCPHCSSSNLRKEPALVRETASGNVTGFYCNDCKIAFIPHPNVVPKTKYSKLNITTAPAAAGYQATAHADIETPKPAPYVRYGCPKCGETENLLPNPGLTREQDGKTITGHICGQCGMAFIDHPQLQRFSLNPSRLRPGPLPDVTEKPPKSRHVPMMPMDKGKGNGQWLVPRKEKPKPRDDGPSFRIGK